MARTNGLTGGITGKVGSMVFYYRDGKYIARQYVPNIANPKSERQVAQRLKMALAGRLSSVVPYGALEGYEGSRTQRRSAFMRSVLLASTVSEGRASIAAPDIVFSEGSMSELKRHQVTGSADVSIRSVTFTLSDDLGHPVVPEGYGERYVVLFMNTETSVFDYCVTGLLNIPADGETATTVASVRVGTTTGVSYVWFAYSYPYLTGSSDGRMRTSFLGVEGETVVVDLLTGETLGSPVEFGRSVFLGSGTIQPPA